MGIEAEWGEAAKTLILNKMTGTPHPLDYALIPDLAGQAARLIFDRVVIERESRDDLAVKLMNGDYMLRKWRLPLATLYEPGSCLTLSDILGSFKIELNCS